MMNDFESERRCSSAELESICLDLYKDSRVSHIRGCVDSVVKLSERWAPAAREELIRAAYLHDITKRFSYSSQLILCRKYGILLTSEDLSSPEVIHAITAAHVAENMFHETRTVVDAIRWHTTGHPGMKIEEIIMFLADMIEPSRSYPELQEIRDAVDISPYYGLEVALMRSLEFIRSKGQIVHSASEEAYRWICTINSGK